MPVLVGALVDTGAALATFVLALVGSIWAVERWLYRPRFLCGVAPGAAEQTAGNFQPGRVTAFASYQHNPRYLAQPYAAIQRLIDRRRKPNLNELGQRYFRPTHCRWLDSDEQGGVRLPVVVVNRGQRMARDYWLSIIFIACPISDGPVERIGVRGLASANLRVERVYADQPARLTEQLQKHAVSPAVLSQYASVQGEERRWGDGIDMHGSLEAGERELIELELEVGAATDRFLVVFAIDCPDWLSSAQFVQACEVRRAPRLAKGNNLDASSAVATDQIEKG